MHKQRIVVGITGATGVIYSLKLLETLSQQPDWETHLIISDAGVINLQHELNMKRQAVYQLADVIHDNKDISASIASGAFKTDGMVIIPCSMKTLSSVAHGFSDNLIARAADVTLKERRRLILMPREAPLSLIHLKNMLGVTEMGGIIFPPMPAFYGHSKSLESLVNESVGRVLEMMGVNASNLYEPWTGLKK